MTREQLEADLVRAAYALLTEMNAAGARLPIPGGTIFVERGDAQKLHRGSIRVSLTAAPMVGNVDAGAVL